jgi:hypothetical protein
MMFAAGLDIQSALIFGAPLALSVVVDGMIWVLPDSATSKQLHKEMVEFYQSLDGSKVKYDQSFFVLFYF